jgi:hypothetical protein
VLLRFEAHLRVRNATSPLRARLSSRGRWHALGRHPVYVVNPAALRLRWSVGDAFEALAKRAFARRASGYRPRPRAGLSSQACYGFRGLESNTNHASTAASAEPPRECSYRASTFDSGARQNITCRWCPGTFIYPESRSNRRAFEFGVVDTRTQLQSPRRASERCERIMSTTSIRSQSMGMFMMSRGPRCIRASSAAARVTGAPAGGMASGDDFN